MSAADNQIPGSVRNGFDYNNPTSISQSRRLDRQACLDCTKRVAPCIRVTRTTASQATRATLLAGEVKPIATLLGGDAKPTATLLAGHAKVSSGVLVRHATPWLPLQFGTRHSFFRVSRGPARATPLKELPPNHARVALAGDTSPTT
jgi:hypothetical protein